MGIFNAKKRPLVTKIAQLFGYATEPEVPLEIPEVPLEAVAPHNTPILLLEIEQTDGNVSLLEHLCLAKITAGKKPSAIFEIGTFDGRTTLNFAANGGPKTSIYTLDLPKKEVENTAFAMEKENRNRKFIEKETSGEKFRNTVYEKQITQLYGDSADFNYTAYEKNMDIVFVDGSHDYKYVVSDTKAAEVLIRKGGLILWHDYGIWDGVTEAINELYEKNSDYKKLRRLRGTSLVFLSR